jgi:hypothetical protein
MDKQELIQGLENLLTGTPWGLRNRLVAHIQELKKTYIPKPRTPQQNKGLHKFCSLLSDSLNLSGKEMRLILKPTHKIWWTPEAVKKELWKPVMKQKFGYESTTELKKIGDIDLIHEDLMRMLGENHGVEYIPFPHDPNKGQDWADGARKIIIKN